MSEARSIEKFWLGGMSEEVKLRFERIEEVMAALKQKEQSDEKAPPGSE